MDLSELLSPKKKEMPVIQPEIDPNKYTKIVTTLCEKRKTLELAIQNNTSENKEDDVISLLQLKQAMTSFGVTEITYQAYLAKSSFTPTTRIEQQASTNIAVIDVSSTEDSFSD